MKYYNILCTGRAAICTIFVIIVIPRYVYSVGYDYDTGDDQSGEDGQTLSWCYITSTCNETSSSSDWQQGTCKSGKRQSPIDIRTDNLTPLKRRKRRVTLRRHRPRGRGFDKDGVPLSPVLTPPLHPAFASEDRANRDTDFMEAGGLQGFTPSMGNNMPVPIRGDERQVNVPSTVEQGLLCSPQPHWNIIWVNGKPYRYWIQMHLCRLILRQQAQFILQPVKSTTEKPGKPDTGSSSENGTDISTTTEEPVTDTPKPISTTTSSSKHTSTKKPTTTQTPTTTSKKPPTTTTGEGITTTGSGVTTTGEPPTSSPPSSPTTPTITTTTSKPDGNGTPPPIKIDFSEGKENYVMKEFGLWNNGRTMQMNSFVPETGTAPTFAWPDQNDAIYKLDQVHFHWGPRDNVGSEHTIDGKAYSAEMHLVHFRSTEGNQGFDDLKSAIESGMGNAIAVIAVFLQVDDSITTSFLQPHINNFAKVPRTGDRMTVLCTDARLRLDQVLERAMQAFTYMGSFTTPKSCSEIVAWIVCKEPIPISREDIQTLRSSVMEGDYPLFMNYRSTQKTNQQPVSLIGIKQKSAA